mgnify:CR=1 FL=1
MISYLSKRFLFLIPLWIGISIIGFIFIQLSPGDPAEILLQKEGIEPTPEAIETMRSKLGLNDPPYIQYIRWLWKLIHMDIGVSYKTGEPVINELLNRLPATLELTLVSFGFIVILSLMIGLLSALNKHGIFDRVGVLMAIMGASIPSFWLGLILIYLFSIKLRWFPIMGRGSVYHLVLPALTLSFGTLIVQARLLRTSLQEVLRKDFIMTALAKGVSRKRILIRHALPNAVLPLMTNLGLILGRLLGGAVIVETIFAWPGIGRLAVESILQRDYPVIQGYLLLTALIFVFINLCVDVGYRLIDPRIELDR